jgi:rhodanese-related sulfurtransferase
MFNLFSPETVGFKNLGGKEFKEAYEVSRSPILIDVRTAGEYASGTITGSKNIDIMSPLFKETISKLEKDKQYFLFCRSGSRSAQACAIMAKEGFQVANLKGGIGEWTCK